MKAVVQRVSSASVVAGSHSAGIAAGMLVLLGVSLSDTAIEANKLIKKIISLRIFNDANGKMNLSLQDMGGDILLISQFTLLADCKKGNRPSFMDAAAPTAAQNLYNYVAAQLQTALGKPVPTGIFGADMQVSLVNDGPVTIILDTALL